MALRSTPPFRGDHVGSLLRPPELLEARRRHAAGEIDDAALREAEDAAIRDVVAMQREVGLQTVTDGEFRRTSWHMDFIYRLGGISSTDDRLTVSFKNREGGLSFEARGLAVTDRISLPEPIFADDFAFVQSVAGEVQTPKLTIPSPSMVHYRGGPASIDPEVYPDVEDYWTDLADAYAAQIRALGEQGCTYLQMDDTSLAYLNDPAQRQMVRDRGDDPDELLERYIDTMNRAIAAKPDGMAITTHMCRGNFQSSWAAEGGYDQVAEALLTTLDVDGFFMEFDDERSGTFAPLRHLPEGKVVVLGLMTTKTGELEDPEVLKARIDQATEHVPLDQLCLSPQCGFSSTVEGNKLTAEQQAAKLRLIVDLAEQVWG
ncbi:5-methyltetrahydropteroyltriglutamate--homocysteine S-methyltransferase [Euzebya sp.]|uniref:5-methyltetrahydropteroyltriglutamate-- homocysteine S-methyltransferase n=1 Tax=Euzebya sp. TaxID=1971409 RepID=UPI003518F2B2